jgi:hypothetical protein
VAQAGYSAGFLVMAAIAAAGFLVFLLAMPESKVADASPESEAGRGEGPGNARMTARQIS